MSEILDDPGVLARRDLEPTALRLAGVPFGARAADALPRHRITGITMAPIVRRLIAGTGTGMEYYGADGRRLHRDEVIDSVLTAGGMLHVDGHVSYKIGGGRVVGFALSGADSGHLAHFGFLATYEQFLAEFGMPDRAEESRAYGDLMGYANYYWRSRKQACWSASDEDGSGHLSLVNLGDYDGNAGPSSP